VKRVRTSLGTAALAAVLVFQHGGNSAMAETGWQRPFAEVAGLAASAPDETVRYGEAPSKFAELWLPAGGDGPHPVVILVHGGCWLAEYDLAHVRPLAAALAQAGYATWSLEYRRVGEAGGGWPGTFEDVAAAVDFLARRPDSRLDPDRIVLAGHSAGGHLALWAAARARLPANARPTGGEPFVPRGAIGLAAITDLAAYAAGGNSCQQVTPRLMGGMPDEQPARYAQASPAALGAAVPTVLLQGGEDRIVPREQAAALAGARVESLPEAGHFDVVHPGTPAFARILVALDELLADGR